LTVCEVFGVKTKRKSGCEEGFKLVIYTRWPLIQGDCNNVGHCDDSIFKIVSTLLFHSGEISIPIA
jgi:hypothetical protein